MANRTIVTEWNKSILSIKYYQTFSETVKKIKVKARNVLHGQAISELQGVIKVWCHKILLAARHKQAHRTFQFTYPGGMEGWVDLGALITPQTGTKPMTAWSKVRCSNRCATEIPRVPTSSDSPVMTRAASPFRLKAFSSRCASARSETGLNVWIACVRETRCELFAMHVAVSSLSPVNIHI